MEPVTATARDRLLPGWILAAGLSAALCAGCLDLILSLWLDPPTGMRSGANVMLAWAVTASVALIVFLFGFVLLRRVFRMAPLPLALALASLEIAWIVLRGIARSLGAGMWRQDLLLIVVAAAVSLLVFQLTRTGPERRSLWRRLSVGAPLAGAAVLLLLWIVQYGSPVAAWGAEADPSAGPRKAHAVRRVILLSVDTLRADALSVYGGESRTPSLDRLAGDSVVFQRAYSPASWTLPSMASVMTGVSPQVHQALRTRSRVPDRLLTLAEVLRRDGYRTAALVSSTVLGSAANLTQGFDEYRSFPAPWLGRSFGAAVLTARAKAFRPDEAPPPDMAEAAIDWLRAHRGDDFFLWVHLFDPHGPYGPPRRYLDGRRPPPGGKWRFEGWDEEAIRAGTWVPNPGERDWIRRLYQGEVRWADDFAGRIVDELKRLGIYEDALVVVLSDHGEEFWEHGSYGHGHTLYDEILRVPLLLKLPRSSRTGRVDSPVSTASVAPTLLDLCGLPFPTGHPSAGSLASILQGRAPASAPLLALGLNRYEDRQSVRFGSFKYVRWEMSGREELYDLTRDSGEQHDLAANDPSGIAEGRRLLAAFEAKSRKARQILRLGGPEEAKLDPYTMERLRSLGYAR
ncbi:MAG TPA: sulfatase [Thermoanaerobaculia bacterium]